VEGGSGGGGRLMHWEKAAATGGGSGSGGKQQSRVEIYSYTLRCEKPPSDSVSDTVESADRHRNCSVQWITCFL